MRNPKKLFVATIVIGVLSLVAFWFERLALTDIFHGEPDVHLEWAVVNAALIPIALFHILGLISVGVALKHIGHYGNPSKDTL